MDRAEFYRLDDVLKVRTLEHFARPVDMLRAGV